MLLNDSIFGVVRYDNDQIVSYMETSCCGNILMNNARGERLILGMVSFWGASKKERLPAPQTILVQININLGLTATGHAAR